MPEEQKTKSELDYSHTWNYSLKAVLDYNKKEQSTTCIFRIYRGWARKQTVWQQDGEDRYNPVGGVVICRRLWRVPLLFLIPHVLFTELPKRLRERQQWMCFMQMCNDIWWVLPFFIHSWKDNSWTLKRWIIKYMYIYFLACYQYCLEFQN